MLVVKGLQPIIQPLQLDKKTKPCIWKNPTIFFAHSSRIRDRSLQKTVISAIYTQNALLSSFLSRKMFIKDSFLRGDQGGYSLFVVNIVRFQIRNGFCSRGYGKIQRRSGTQSI